MKKLSCHYRKPLHWGARRRTYLLAILLVVTALIAGPSGATTQLGGSLLTVYAEPTEVRPGMLVSFTARASGVGPYAVLTVRMPNELSISGDVVCVHSTYYCDDYSISDTDPETLTLSLSAPGNNVSVPANWPMDGYSARVTLTVSFSVYIPLEAERGTRYPVDFHVSGLFNPLYPADEAGRSVSAVIEVLDGTGPSNPPPPTTVATSFAPPTTVATYPPSPTTVATPPAPQATSTPQLEVAIFLSPSATNDDIYLVPGQTVHFKVYSAFPELAGNSSVRLSIPAGFSLVEGPSCDLVLATCGPIYVTQEADGTTRITVAGIINEFGQMNLDFTVNISEDSRLGEGSTIVGEYLIVDSESHQIKRSRQEILIHLADGNSYQEIWESQDNLRLTFQLRLVTVEDNSSCISLNQIVGGGSRYFVCDNDSAVAKPVDATWELLSDSNPNNGVIDVSVGPGTYYLSIESLPDGLEQLPTVGPQKVIVTTLGTSVTVALGP